MQATTINFTLANGAGTSVVGSASYDSTTDTATFTPSAALANGTTYTATVSGAKDAAGDPMSAAISWSFTTAVETTFYVSPTGNDSGPGTQQSPWLTLQNAANEVVAGDTVIVEPGNYAGFALGYENPQTGTASAPITWQAQPGAVIDARNPYTADGIDLESASYINVEGFTVDNTSGTITRAGIRAVNDTNVLIENNTAENCGQWAIFSGFSNNLDIVDNVASGSTVQHGIYVSNTCSNPAIIGNTVFGNNESGIELNGDASEGGTGIITAAAHRGQHYLRQWCRGGIGDQLRRGAEFGDPQQPDVWQPGRGHRPLPDRWRRTIRSTISSPTIRSSAPRTVVLTSIFRTYQVSRSITTSSTTRTRRPAVSKCPVAACRASRATTTSS